MELLSVSPSSAFLMAKPTSAYDFSARDLATGDVVELSEYAGSVSLFVNVASQ